MLHLKQSFKKAFPTGGWERVINVNNYLTPKEIFA